MSIKRLISGGLKQNRMLGNILPSAMSLEKLKISAACDLSACGVGRDWRIASFRCATKLVVLD